MSHSCWRATTAFVAVVVLAGGSGGRALADDFQTSIQALEWRNIGPFNGGRGTSVVGHPTDPHGLLVRPLVGRAVEDR